MTLAATGLSHSRTPLEILEKAVIPQQDLSQALGEILNLPGINAVVILSTCNRCEIYTDIDTIKSGDDILKWLSNTSGLSTEVIKKHAFNHSDKATVYHLMEVASSLDSMILGEAQILSQTKTALQAALEAGTSNSHLSRLFETALNIGKQVRHDTELSKHPISFASIAAKTSKKIFRDLSSKQALLIGTGEMIQLTGRYLYDLGVQHITVAGRSPDKAHNLALKFQGQIIPIAEIDQHLEQFDIIISCTASDSIILGKYAVEQALKKRKHRPIYMVDMALPRDIESSISTLEDVYLYTLQTLAKIVENNQTTRKNSIQQAQSIIQTQTNKYFEWLNSRHAADLISQLYDTANRDKDKVLEKAMKMLQHGKSPEEALSYLASTLTNKLTHTPTTLLKESAECGDFALLERVKKLLNET